MVTEAELSEQVDKLTDMIRDTQEYKDYIHMVEVIRRNPELCDEVMRFRKENFFLQHAPEHEDVSERLEALCRRNEDFLDTPEVYDFFMTEWSFYQIVQNLHDRLMEGIDF